MFDQFHTYVNFPQDHPLHGGFDAAPHLEEADAILVVESDVPWFPQLKRPRPETRVVHVGVDPLFSRYPIRGFPADLALAGTPRLALAALADAVARRVDAGAVAERRQRWEAAHAERARGARPRSAARSRPTRPSTWRGLSRCDRRRWSTTSTIVVNEYDLDATQARFTRPGSYFAAPPSGGLGWGLGAALGAKLAAPDTDGDLLRGRRRLHLRLAHRRALRLARLQPARPVRRLQQPHVERGEARGADLRARRLGGADRLHAAHRARARARLRDDLPGLGRPRRAGRGSRRSCPTRSRRALRIVKDEKRQVVLNVICKKP